MQRNIFDCCHSELALPGLSNVYRHRSQRSQQSRYHTGTEMQADALFEGHALYEEVFCLRKQVGDDQYKRFKCKKLTCEYEASWAIFTTIARPIVGIQPLQRARRPSSLVIRVRALTTFE